MSVCLFVCLALNSSERVDPNGLKISFGVEFVYAKKVLDSTNVRRKIEEILTILATILLITSFFSDLIYPSIDYNNFVV